MSRLKYSVGVTGVHSIANTPGLNVIRSLKEIRNAHIMTVALDYNPLSFGFYTDVIDVACMIPNPYSDEQGLISKLLSFAKEFKLNCLIPTLDFEMPFFTKHQDFFRRNGIYTVLPSSEKIRVVNNKARFHDFVNKAGLPHPKTRISTSMNDLEEIAHNLGFPLVIKGYVRGQYIAHDLDEAQVFYKRIEEWSSRPPIIQEFIQGEQYCETGVVNSDGSLIGSVQMKKLGLAESGASLSAITINNSALHTLTIHAIERLQWIGAFEAEYIYSDELRKFLIIEFNSRFPAWIYLATKAGINLPWIMVKIAMEEKVETAKFYKTGLIYIRNAWDITFPIEILGRLLVTGRYIPEKAL